LGFIVEKIFIGNLNLTGLFVMNNKNQKIRDHVSTFPRHHQGENYSTYRLISIIGFFVILGLLVILGAQYIQYARAKQELEVFEARLREHEARQAAVEREIERLKDLDYIEVLARERLGLVKPDDIIFQLED